MSYPRVTLAWAVSLAALAAGCVGCSDREEEKAAEGSEGIDSEPPMFGWVDPDKQVVESYPVLGQEDADNRYPSAVIVSQVPRERPDHRTCAGVLLASNLVLTAAHCLCTPKPGETIRFDGSGCAAKVRVKSYNLNRSIPSEPGGVTRSTYGDGNVLIHPQFQIVLDPRGAVVTSRADLAVIRLEHPVPEISPVRLATEEVKAGEVLSVVGYEYMVGGGMLGQRGFSREKVQAPADGERLLFGSMEHAGYNGDTGGPCLRETKQGLELVGISQRGLGLTPTFTRIAPYRGWLEEQIRLAGGKR